MGAEEATSLGTVGDGGMVTGRHVVEDPDRPGCGMGDEHAPTADVDIPVIEPPGGMGRQRDASREAQSPRPHLFIAPSRGCCQNT